MEFADYYDEYRPVPIKKITFATLYAIYDDSDDSISDSEDEEFIVSTKKLVNSNKISQTENKRQKRKCTEIYVPKI